jgi:hypothetical protein
LREVWKSSGEWHIFNNCFILFVYFVYNLACSISAFVLFLTLRVKSNNNINIGLL